MIQLREWSPDDADWYASVAATDELIQRFTTESPTLTAAEVRAAIQHLLRGGQNAAGFLIADAGTGQRLGNIAVSYEDGIGDISYWVAPEGRGRGVATQALRQFSEWCFQHLALSELRLWTHADNMASRAVAERAGYLREPARDEIREIKGEAWATVAYSRTRA